MSEVITNKMQEAPLEETHISLLQSLDGRTLSRTWNKNELITARAQESYWGKASHFVGRGDLIGEIVIAGVADWS